MIIIGTFRFATTSCISASVMTLGTSGRRTPAPYLIGQEQAARFRDVEGSRVAQYEIEEIL